MANDYPTPFIYSFIFYLDIVFRQKTFESHSKPTLTTVVQTEMKPDHFPDIILCPDESFDLEEIERLGYLDILTYNRGTPKENQSLGFGWLGLGGSLGG